MGNPIGSLAVSDTGFVFDPRTGHTYSVNQTGLAVLRGLKDGHSLQQIHEELSSGFEQAAGVDEHVRQFVQLLTELGLVPESELWR
jgi:PqqD family protein of HPr-rel-A system